MLLIAQFKSQRIEFKCWCHLPRIGMLSSSFRKESTINFDLLALEQSISSTMAYFRFSDEELCKIINLKFIICPCHVLQLILSLYNMPSILLNLTLTKNWRLYVCRICQQYVTMCQCCFLCTTILFLRWHHRAGLIARYDHRPVNATQLQINTDRKEIKKEICDTNHGNSFDFNNPF